MGGKFSKPRILGRRQDNNIDNFSIIPVEHKEEEYEDTIYDANFSWLDGRRVSDDSNDSIYLFGRYSEETGHLSHLFHVIFKYILRGNTRIPLTPEIKDCLHIGAGHYIWLVEMANDHKEIRFEGFDIAHTPKDNLTILLPPNANLRKGNIFNGLPYPDETFDYVNVRSLLAWTHPDKIPIILNEVKRVAKKGAWIELLELDPFLKNTTLYYENHLGKIWKEICKFKGYSSSKVINLDKQLIQQGFSEVKSSKLSIPLGSYGGKVGELYAKQFIDGSNAVASMVMSKLDMTDEEIQNYLEECVREFNLKQSYSNSYLICARKF